MVRRDNILIFLIASLIACAGINAFSAIPPMTLPADPGESVTLFTDRDIYMVSEDIFYSAFYKQSLVGENSSWSTVMYVELIKWDGTSIAQTKAVIEDNKAHGKLSVPDNIPSGVYYLRAYTKWMRNYSPYNYEYLLLKIINPLSKEIDKGPGSRTISSALTSNDIGAELEVITLNGLKEIYQERELVSFDLQASNKLASGPFSLSIAKHSPQNESGRPGLRVEEQGSNTLLRSEFLPEIDGLAVSGRVVDKESGAAIANTKVQLSSYASSYLFSEASTNEDGTFLFTLPNDNVSMELHISEDADSSEFHEILITSEYCNLPVELPYIPFSLSEEERSLANELLINAQLTRNFSEAKSEDAQHDLRTAFYGKPVTVTYVDEYVELTDIREFVYELIVHVSIKHSDKTSYLSINGQSSLDFYPALVLMDNIPVMNNETLLSIPIRRIERIEVINTGYIIGEYKYSGVISIFSKNHDMAGISIGEGSHFFNYGFVDNNRSEKPGIAEQPGSAMPDRRNLLYWDADLNIQEDVARVSFYTSDAPGKYDIRLMGVDKDQNPLIFKLGSFMVQ